MKPIKKETKCNYEELRTLEDVVEELKDNENKIERFIILGTNEDKDFSLISMNCSESDIVFLIPTFIKDVLNDLDDKSKFVLTSMLELLLQTKDCKDESESMNIYAKVALNIVNQKIVNGEELDEEDLRIKKICEGILDESNKELKNAIKN